MLNVERINGFQKYIHGVSEMNKVTSISVLTVMAR